MKNILSFFKTEKLALGLALLAASINQIFSLLNPQVFGKIIDDYASNISQFTEREFIVGVSILLIIYIAFALISRIAKAFQDYLVSVVSEKIGTSLYANYVKKVFELPYKVFEDEQSGSLLQKMQKARDTTKNFITGLINIGFFSLIGIIFVLIYAVSVHPLIALVFVLAIPVISIVISYVGKGVKKAQENIVRTSAELAASTTETLSNVGLVKSLGLENQEINRLNEVNKKILDLEIKKVVILRRLSFIQGTLVNTISSLIILVSMILIAQASISLGEFLTLWFYGFFVFGPLSQISILVSSYQESMASIQEVTKILQKQVPNIQLRIGGGIKAEGISNIALENLHFNYGNHETLSGINMNIQSGKTIAIVGRSGAGKSTIIKLILGLYSPTSGEVRFNNISTDDLDMTSIRENVGYVPQDTQVFAGTIRENLLFVSPHASDEECIDALTKAQAQDILNRSADGLDTVLGEHGIKLSGGERQRIAIARALLRKPDVLIFDEASSSLDVKTEADITETIRHIREEYPHLIMIIIAHRLTTVKHADTIYVLKHGVISESGKHDELLEKKGLYYSLWQE